MSEEKLQRMFYDVIRLSMSLSTIARFYNYDRGGKIDKQLVKVADSLNDLLQVIKQEMEGD